LPTYDLHQHLWPEPFISALSRRSERPRLRDDRLETVEGDFDVDLRAHDIAARIALLDRDRIDVAVLSLPPTLGIEELPNDEAKPLLDAWHEGACELAAASGGRLVAVAASTSLDGFPGASVSARALVAHGEQIASLLRALERSGRFLFVHPGPGRRQSDRPGWWAAVVDYTAEMQAAYAAWLARGAASYPGLRIVFAILAGGGPFQLERLRSRGVEVGSNLHPNVFFDTASYGRRALELCLVGYGVRQLVYGSDVPVIDSRPTLQALRDFGDAVSDAVCGDNPELLLGSRAEASGSRLA
jgi:predicted TIM-barrel fold metal-dependent hydrolase